MNLETRNDAWFSRWEEAFMSRERITIAPEFFDIMPPEYQDLVTKATYGNESRGWKDIGTSKELIEEHSLCAGCPESMAFRYILASPICFDNELYANTGGQA